MADDYIKAMRYGIEKKMPSGLTLWLKPIDAGMLLADSTIPQPLMDILQEHLTGVKPASRQAIADSTADAVANATAQEGIDLWKSIRTFGEIVASRCVVKPKIVENPQTEDEISLKEISTSDLTELGKVVGMPLQDLITFQFQQNQAVEPVRGEQESQDNAEPASEPGTLAGGNAGLGTGDVVDSVSVQHDGDEVRDVDREQGDGTGSGGETEVQTGEPAPVAIG